MGQIIQRKPRYRRIAVIGLLLLVGSALLLWLPWLIWEQRPGSMMALEDQAASSMGMDLPEVALLREQALVRWEANDGDAAMALLDQATTTAPDNVKTLMLRAQLAQYRGDEQAARADLDRVIALDPMQIKALTRRDALVSPEDASDIDPPDLSRLQARPGMGVMTDKNGEQIGVMFMGQPGGAGFSDAAAWPLILRERWDNARQMLAFSAMVESDSPAPHAGLGHIALLNDDTEGAYAHYRKGLALVPDRTTLYGLLGDLEELVARGWQAPAVRAARDWLHASYLRDHALENQLNIEAVAAIASADYSAARGALQQSLALAEQRLGASHPEIAETLHWLGLVNINLGDIAAGKTVLERALQINEASYGPEHAAITSSLAALAQTYGALGAEGKMLALTERALKINEAVYGRDHPAVAVEMNNLAAAYIGVDNIAAAMDLVERVARIEEQLYGPEPTQALVNIPMRAGLYHGLGDLDTAKDLYERRLRVNEATLGPDNSFVSQTAQGLAGVYQDLGELDQAQRLLERALTIDERLFGPHFPDVAGDLVSLGSLHRAKQDLATAKSFYERALHIYEHHLGPHHVSVGGGLNGLGRVYLDLGDLDQAQQLLRRALPLVASPDAPQLPRGVLRNLRRLHAAAGHPDLAIFYGKQVVDGLQVQRARLITLDQRLQASYLASVRDDYELLFEQLTAQQRLDEAGAISAMLIVPSQGGASGGAAAEQSPLARVTYNAFEQKQLADLRRAVNEVAGSARTLASLQLIKPEARSEGQQQRIAEIDSELAVARAGYEASIAALERAFIAR